MSKKLLLAFFFMYFSTLCGIEKVQENPKVLIFDLGGVFFGLNGTAMGMEAAGDGSKLWGGLNVLMYALGDQKNPFKDVKKKFFETLDQFPLKPEDGFRRACESSGDQMPYVLCAYQAGRISSKQLLTMANEVCDRLKGERFFASDREEALIRNVIKRTFSPEIHAKYTYALPTAVEYLKLMHESKKYKIIALSNWDKESFAFVRRNFAKEFSYFDDIIISGDIGTVKPNDASFEAVVQKLEWQGYSKKDCVFIDDQCENVEAAIQYGMPALLVKKGDSQSLAEALQKLGILPETPRQSSLIAHKNALLITSVAVASVWLAYTYGFNSF